MDDEISTTYSLDVELELQFPERWSGAGLQTLQSQLEPHAIQNIEINPAQDTIRLQVVESGENPAAALIKLIRIIEITALKVLGDNSGVINRANIQRMSNSAKTKETPASGH